MLSVKHPNLVPLNVNFRDYGISGVVGKSTYIMTLLLPDQRKQKLTINYTPATAMVIVDSKVYRGNGHLELELLVGDHNYVIAEDGYDSIEGVVKLNATSPRTITETLTRTSTSQSVATDSNTTSHVASPSTVQPSEGMSSMPQNRNIETVSVNGVSFNMIRVEGGTFRMGSDDRDAGSDEEPVHQVTLSSYSIGETEVTQVLWQAVMGRNPSKFKGEKHPVEKVSWKDCQKFIDKLNQMGVIDTLPYDIPGAHIARINKPNPGDYVTISKMVYGYSVELTPVQIAMIYAAIANGGRLIHPSLVRELRMDEHMTYVTTPQIIREQFCSPEAIADIRKALHDVVWNNEMGTAALSNGWQQAQSELVHIAGKTGTAQLHTSGGGYDSDHHRISFVGYFPEENPQYSCICVIEAPQRREDLNPKTINAGRGCGAIVRKIAEKVMAYTGCYVMENNQLTLQQRIK